MKCSKCPTELNPTTANYKHKEKGIFQSLCKVCNREYQKSHYQANKQSYLAKTSVRSKAVITENRIKSFEYLKQHPCIDCGESDPIVLEYDHVRGVKVMSVSALIGNGFSWDRVQKEIEKCEVRCANCHKRKTAKQFNFYKYLDMAHSSIG